MKKSQVIKRSIVVGGNKTSVTSEKIGFKTRRLQQVALA